MKNYITVTNGFSLNYIPIRNIVRLSVWSGSVHELSIFCVDKSQFQLTFDSAKQLHEFAENIMDYLHEYGNPITVYMESSQ